MNDTVPLDFRQSIADSRQLIALLKERLEEVDALIDESGPTDELRAVRERLVAEIEWQQVAMNALAGDASIVLGARRDH